MPEHIRAGIKMLFAHPVALLQVIDKQGLELIKKVQGVTTNNERPIPEVMISETEVVFEAPKS